MEKNQQNPSSFFYCVFCDENPKSGKGTYDFHYPMNKSICCTNLHKGLLFSVQLLTECNRLCKSCSLETLWD